MTGILLRLPVQIFINRLAYRKFGYATMQREQENISRLLLSTYYAYSNG